MMRCCFNKRVWIGLGVLAAGLLIADARAGWVALPVLTGLACPVSMLVMMRGMRHDTGATIPAAAGGEQDAAGSGAAGDRAGEIARLRREIRLVKARATDTPAATAGEGPAVGMRRTAG